MCWKTNNLSNSAGCFLGLIFKESLVVLLWAGSAGFCVVRFQMYHWHLPIGITHSVKHNWVEICGTQKECGCKQLQGVCEGTHEGGQVLLDWNKQLHGPFRPLNLLPFMLSKRTSKAGSLSAWMLMKSLVLEPCFSALGMGGGVPQTSPDGQHVAFYQTPYFDFLISSCTVLQEYPQQSCLGIGLGRRRFLLFVQLFWQCVQRSP